jgi:hypothetical protein
MWERSYVTCTSQRGSVCIVIQHEADESKLNFFDVQKEEQIEVKDATH